MLPPNQDSSAGLPGFGGDLRELARQQAQRNARNGSGGGVPATGIRDGDGWRQGDTLGGSSSSPEQQRQQLQQARGADRAGGAGPQRQELAMRAPGEVPGAARRGRRGVAIPRSLDAHGPHDLLLLGLRDRARRRGHPPALLRQPLGETVLIFLHLFISLTLPLQKLLVWRGFA
jgi:hypothetical protein